MTCVTSVYLRTKKTKRFTIRMSSQWSPNKRTINYLFSFPREIPTHQRWHSCPSPTFKFKNNFVCKFNSGGGHACVPDDSVFVRKVFTEASEVTDLPSSLQQILYLLTKKRFAASPDQLEDGQFDFRTQNTTKKVTYLSIDGVNCLRKDFRHEAYHRTPSTGIVY